MNEKESLTIDDELSEFEEESVVKNVCSENEKDTIQSCYGNRKSNPIGDNSNSDNDDDDFLEGLPVHVSQIKMRKNKNHVVLKEITNVTPNKANNEELNILCNGSYDCYRNKRSKLFSIVIKNLNKEGIANDYFKQRERSTKES